MTLSVCGKLIVEKFHTCETQLVINKIYIFTMVNSCMKIVHVLL
jgi:hypothetical protein